MKERDLSLELHKMALKKIFDRLENGYFKIPNNYELKIFDGKKLDYLKEDLEKNLLSLEINIVSIENQNWLLCGIDEIVNLYMLYKDIELQQKSCVINPKNENIEAFLRRKSKKNIKIANVQKKIEILDTKVNINWYFASNIDIYLKWSKKRKKSMRGAEKLKYEIEEGEGKWLELKI